MDFLTTEIRGLPLGVWISISIVSLIGGANLIFQGISTFNWPLALKLKVQEHAPDDPDPVNRTHMVMEWGHAVADFFSFMIIVPVSVILTIKGHYWGFVLSTFLYIFYFYVGILAVTQRVGLVKFGLKESFKEYVKTVTALWVFFVLPAVIGAISL